MKKIVLILLLLAPVAVWGQSLRSFEMRLGHGSAEGARVDVEDMGRADGIVRSVPAGDPERMVSGYRVEIFSDNSANARARAYEAYAKFRELCPDVASDPEKDIGYDSPKYTVRVGRFLTHEEALVLCGRLRYVFAAYPRNEQFPLSEFAVDDKAIALPDDTEAVDEGY